MRLFRGKDCRGANIRPRWGTMGLGFDFWWQPKIKHLRLYIYIIYHISKYIYTYYIICLYMCVCMCVCVYVSVCLCVCVYRLNRRKTSSLYYIIYGRGQRDLQLWPLPTKLHTGDQVNVPACPALGAFKTQLGGHNIFFAVVLYCHCPL